MVGNLGTNNLLIKALGGNLAYYFFSGTSENVEDPT